MSVAPGVMTPAQRRRRDVLLMLAGVVVLTFLGAVITRSTMIIALQLLADAALAGYVYLLVQHKQRAQVTRAPRPLPDRPAPPRYTPGPSYGLGGMDLRARASADPRLVPLRTSASS